VLPAGAYNLLQNLAAKAHYGSTPNEVARYFILRSLDDLIRSGAVFDKTPFEGSSTFSFDKTPFEGSSTFSKDSSR
jgi:hypothetical protein